MTGHLSLQKKQKNKSRHKLKTRSPWVYRLRVMPLLVLVAALSFGVRFGEFMTGVSAMPGSANAQSTAQENATRQDIAAQLGEVTAAPEEGLLAQASELMEIAQKEEMQTEEGGVVSLDGADAEPKVQVSNSVKNTKEWRDSSDTDFEFSEVRMELFEDLAARRELLEEQERELEVREALLQAAEKEIDQKYKELISLRSEIQDLLKEQSEEEKKRTASLVKIYEGMKPKDAARIFNTLDLDILLNVVSQMSERKSAPIIASMEPDRARTLTMMLMEQKSLPDISEGLSP